MSTFTFLSKQRWVIVLVSLLVGGGLGFAYASSQEPAAPVLSEQREIQSTYPFINPLLACGDENFSHISNSRVAELEDKVTQLINAEKVSGTVTEGAVYFRQLNSGPWFGVNEDTLFTPGSLLKVPLILSVYAHAENDSSFFNKTILYEGGAAEAKEHYVSAQIQPGGQYTVSDLVRATLVDSDNNAALLLVQLISKEELNNAYSQLGILVPSEGDSYTMTVRTYASFFRILYNATYLNHVDSNRVLQLLSQTTFTDGLVAGVPQGVGVAHKFGERAIEGGDTEQLHDCGVVYKANHPYLLCVMMRGAQFDSLAHVIRDISKLVYTYAD